MNEVAVITFGIYYRNNQLQGCAVEKRIKTNKEWVKKTIFSVDDIKVIEALRLIQENAADKAINRLSIATGKSPYYI